MSPKNESQSDIGSIPPELTVSPLALVFFVGLDRFANPVHRRIWELFTNQENSTVLYRLVENDVDFPPVKPKKSYDWYVPKGILKKNWLSKHLYRLPSLLVCFAELDWDDVNFQARVEQIYSQFEPIRSKLNGHETRIAFVLLQNNLSIPTEETVSKERFIMFCDICRVEPTSLFVLPIQDQINLPGYILRISSAFFSLSCDYYSNQMKNIKAHKELLNKTNHGLLFVRHPFKLAFFYEIRQDLQNALRSYKQAYLNLMDVRQSTTNKLEIKTVAGFINYKICYLYFVLNEPKEAIAQFEKHMNFFKDDTGSDELIFEDHAWSSKQFSLFGDLFDEAIISNKFRPSKIQNPGYYYYEAARHSINRQKFSSDLLKQLSFVQYPQAVNNNVHDLEFYGQRFWRPGSQSLKPLDPEKENEGLLALKFRELNQINHSAIVISLLVKAMNQFNKYQCPRMTRYMMVLAADEHFDTDEYEKCLNYLNQVLPSYRIERWNHLVTGVLTKMLSAAYLSVNFNEFLRIGLEYLSTSLKTQHKEHVRNSVKNLISGRIPIGLIHVEEEKILLVTKSWQQRPCVDQIVTVKMSPGLPLIDVKCHFIKDVFEFDEEIELEIHLKSNIDMELNFQRMQLIFSEDHYNDYCSRSSPLFGGVLLPKMISKEVFKFPSRIRESGKELRLIGMSLTLTEQPNKIILNWVLDSNFNQVKSDYCYQIIPPDKEYYFESISSSFTTQIGKLRPQVECQVSCEHLMVVNEVFPVDIIIRNSETRPLRNVSVLVKPIENLSNFQILSNEKYFDCDRNIPLVENINSDHKMSIGLTGFSDLKELIKAVIIIEYQLPTESNEVSDENEMKYSISRTIEFSVVQNLDWTFELLNILRMQYKIARLLEPFILKVNTRVDCPFPIEIVNITLELGEHFNLLSSQQSNENDSNGCRYKNCVGELGSILNISDDFIVYSDQVMPILTSIGQVVVKWRRIGSHIHNESRCNLPPVQVDNSILYVETILPKMAVTRQHLLLTYNIYNRTNEVLPVELSIGGSENFMFAGNKMIRIEIKPNEKNSQYFMLYPLVCGNWTLPRLSIIAYPDSPNRMILEKMLEDVVPTHLFVMPHDRAQQA